MKNDLRNWSDLRVFLAVFREGSTLAASRRLGVAQPTVARRIDALEHETGLTLFERDTRGFKPTQDARDLFPLAEDVEKAAGKLSERVSELAELRPIRITVPGFFSEPVTEIFTEFAAENPDISIEFILSLKTLNLRDGEADIALRITKNEPDESLICRKISTAQWSLFGGRRYADTYGLPKSVDDLAGHRFVTFQHKDVPSYLHDWLASHVSPDQIIQSFSELDLMHASIKAGHALGLMNLRLAQFDQTLIRCFEPIEDLSRSHLMLISPDAYRRKEIRTFVKFFAPRYAATFK